MPLISVPDPDNSITSLKGWSEQKLREKQTELKISLNRLEHIHKTLQRDLKDIEQEIRKVKFNYRAVKAALRQKVATHGVCGEDGTGHTQGS